MGIWIQQDVKRDYAGRCDTHYGEYHENKPMFGGGCAMQPKCSRNAADFCAVRRYYAEIQEKLEQHLFSISLKEILEREGKGK